MALPRDPAAALESGPLEWLGQESRFRHRRRGARRIRTLVRETIENTVDLLTAAAYVVILVLVVLNAWIVRSSNVDVRNEDDE